MKYLIRVFRGGADRSLTVAAQSMIPRHATDRLEGVNLLNHPSFYVGDHDINSNTFGVIGSMFNSPRVMQIGAKYEF